jgi:ketosteroid isomerase-like protein
VIRAVTIAVVALFTGPALAQSQVVKRTIRAAAASAPETAVRAAMSRFLDALNGLDLDGMTALFTDDVTAFVPTAQGDRVNGKPAVTAIFRAYVDRVRAGGPAGRIVPLDLTVEAAGSLGVVTFNHRDPASGTVRRRTFVFRQAGGAWRISHFHASDFTAPRAP